MNTTISLLLDKISTLNNLPSLSQLDKDSMLEYTRSLYDEILQLSPQKQHSTSPVQPSTNVEASSPLPPTTAAEKTNHIEKTTQEEIPPVQSEVDREMDEILTVADRVRKEEPARPTSTPTPPERNPYVEPTRVETRDNTYVHIPAVPGTQVNGNGSISHQINEMNKEMAELFQTKSGAESMDLSEKLANNRIQNIENAMSLNDKLLYKKVLFSDDEEFSSTLQVIENAYSMSQAKSYLMKIAEKNEWLSDNKEKIAQNFINLIARKFV